MLQEGHILLIMEETDELIALIKSHTGEDRRRLLRKEGHPTPPHPALSTHSFIPL